MTNNTLKARPERCKAFQDNQPGPHDGWVDDKTYVQYVDQPEQVVEVKEGYGITAVKVVPHGHSENVPLSEALTLRTAEDVRREALEEAADKAAEYVGGSIAARGIRSLIDNPYRKGDE